MFPLPTVRAALAAVLTLLLVACASKPSSGIPIVAGDLDDAEVRELVEGAFALAVPRDSLEEQEQLPLRVQGARGCAPSSAAGRPIVAYDAGGDFLRRYTLEVLTRDGPRLQARLVIDNPIGGPSVVELEYDLTDVGWSARVVGATESL